MRQLKKIILTIGLSLIGAHLTMAEEPEKPFENRVIYEAFYRVHLMHCNFLVNGLTVQTTVGVVGKPVEFSFGGRIGTFLTEGDNTIGIQAMNVISDPNQYCEMVLYAQTLDPETDTVVSKEVSMIRVTLDEESNFTTQETIAYPEPTVTSPPTMKEINYKSASQSPINDVIVTRDLRVNHPHRFLSWTYRSSPFIDTPENREKLWAKYEEFRTAMANKDEATIRELLQPGGSETEAYQGSPTIDDTLNMMRRAWEPEDFKMDNIVKDNFQLHTYANARLFRFIHKKDYGRIDSPLSYLSNERNRVFNFTFTLIDGEIVVAE